MYIYSEQKLLSDINSLIVFDITSEEEEDKVINTWVFNCVSNSNTSNSPSDILFVQQHKVAIPPKIKYDAKIICSDATFIALANGKISPEFAYMRGTLKIKGKVNAALKVKSLLSLAASLKK